MGVDDTIYFDEDRYRRELSSYSTEALRKKLTELDAEFEAYNSRLQGGWTFFGLVSGLFALGVVYCGRQCSVVQQQMKVVESMVRVRNSQEYATRRYLPLNPTRQPEASTKNPVTQPEPDTSEVLE